MDKQNSEIQASTVTDSFCSVCGTEIIGNYCHHCGQKITRQKTSSLDITKSLLSGFFSIERGIVGILYSLTVKPRKVVENYWKGNRFYYYNPGQMIFYVIFVLGLHIAFVSKDRLLGVHVTVDASGGLSAIFSPQFLLIVLILPLYSLTTWFSFIKKHKTFPEHFISATYIFAYGAIIVTILCDMLFLLFAFPLENTVIAFFTVLFLWANRIFISTSKWYYHILYLVLQVLVFILLIAVLMGILFLIFGGEGFKRV